MFVSFFFLVELASRGNYFSNGVFRNCLNLFCVDSFFNVSDEAISANFITNEMSDNRTVASILLAEPSANRNSNHVILYPFNNSCINVLFFCLRIFCVLSGIGIILILVFYEQRSVFLYVLISMTSLIVCLVFIQIVIKYKIFCVSHPKKLNISTRISSSSIEHFILKPELTECSARNVYKISSVECLNTILSGNIFYRYLFRL
ncbi:UNVERIFIED_CONTAM: hypothetical protein NCL1_37937 [Trichonephila clavipes]